MVKGILSYGFIEGISKGLNKLVILLLPLFLTTAAFGKLGIILSFELLLPVLFLLGLDRAVLRFQSNEDLAQSLLSTITVAITWLHAIAGLIVVFLYVAGVRTFFGLSLFPDVILLIPLIYLQGIVVINLNKLRVESRHKEYFTYRLAYQLVKIVSIIALAILINSHIAYLIGGIISSGIIVLLLLSKIVDIRKNTFNKGVFIILMSYSWPFIFHGFASNIMGAFDRFVIESNLSLNDVAQYTFAYAIGSAVMFSFIGLSVYMEPLVYKENNLKKRELLLSQYLIYAIGIGSVVTILITVCSNYLVPMFYGPSYRDSLRYLPLIALAHMFLPFYTIANYKLAYEKKTKSIAFVSIFCSIVNVVLNIIMVPVIGVDGAVLATIISYILMAAIFTFVIRDSKPIFVFNLIGITCLIAVSSISYMNLSYLTACLLVLLGISILTFKYSSRIILWRL